MAAINDLISQIQDETLRNRIQEEVSKMAKQKKFGLVFEEHMPESTPLYDMPIKRGCNVMRRDSKDDKSIYVVLKVEGDTAVCVKSEQKDEAVTFELKDIVRVAEFGEPIYPYLKPLDSVCNAPDSDLWHMLIEADNYHALQLLEYLYAGKVDCIYIDPPYNTGAKDWKYNNDYVDGNDAYRHSKWLSFMERRLKLAKKLLNPADSVLIVTIDEKEYLHLGCLLEEMFPEAQIQMVSITINPSGAIRKNLFSRADEYAFFVILGDAHVVQKKGDGDEIEVRWWYLRRLEYGSRRGTVKGGIAQFYPIYIDNETHIFIEFNRDSIDAWLRDPELGALSQKYAQCYKEFCESKEWTVTTLRDARYVLMHTFAHLLIKQMSMSSGYSSSAIRERIYFGDDMSGVLLYTGSADKEGSLGGLVELGNIDQLIVLMKDAFQEALVCTNDPECLNNVPAGNNSNGAACHSCCMISETACENGNRMLDRGLIVPIDGRENQSYFKTLVEELCQLEV